MVPDPAGFFDHQGVLMTDTSERDELVQLAGEQAQFPMETLRQQCQRP